MFGVKSREERRVDLRHVAFVAAVAVPVLAILGGVSAWILGPLERWIRAAERDQLPTFEEEIGVVAPARPVAAGRVEGGAVEPAALVQPLERPEPLDANERARARGRSGPRF